MIIYYTIGLVKPLVACQEGQNVVKNLIMRVSRNSSTYLALLAQRGGGGYVWTQSSNL